MAMAAVVKPTHCTKKADLPIFLQRKIQFREAGTSTLSSSSISYKRHSETKNKTRTQQPLQLSWSSITGIGPGLVNLGNTCFLNATLQCLWYTAPWANYLRTTRHSQKCTRKEACVLCELEALTLQAQPGKRALAPQGMVARMKQVARHFRPYAQQDAHEYLRFLQEALNKCLLHCGDAESESDTVLSQIFGGELRSSITCANCGHASGTVDPFLDLSLDLKKGVHSVAAALQLFTQPELLAEDAPYHCSKCRKAQSGATKRMNLHSLPPVLTLHLKRFSSPYTKITRPINFPADLVVAGYPHTTYSLYAVLVHQGQSCANGHYYSYVKAANNLWYEMDDSSVRQVSLNTVLGQPAYILFYQKQIVSPAVPTTDSESELDVMTISKNSVSSELDHFVLMKQSTPLKNLRSPVAALNKKSSPPSSPIRKSPRSNKHLHSPSSAKKIGEWQVKALK